MEIEIKQSKQTRILSLSGRFDAHTAPEVRSTLQNLVDKGHNRVLVDMAEINFVDSTGLSVLVSAMKHCRQAGGDLVLSQLSRPVRLIFELTRLDKAFGIYPDQETALSELDTE